MMVVLVLRETTTYAMAVEVQDLAEAERILAEHGCKEGHEMTISEQAKWGEPQEWQQTWTIEDGAGNIVL